MAAAAVTGSRVTLTGLDFSDTQGDKEVVDILERMGALVRRGERSMERDGDCAAACSTSAPARHASPALAVAACFADGETRLVNVPQVPQGNGTASA